MALCLGHHESSGPFHQVQMLHSEQEGGPRCSVSNHPTALDLPTERRAQWTAEPAGTSEVCRMVAAGPEWVWSLSKGARTLS